MPLQTGVVVPVFCFAVNKYRIVYLGIIPACRYKLVSHAKAQFNLSGIRHHIALAVMPLLIPCLDSTTAKCKGLLNMLLHFCPKVVFCEDIMHKVLKRLRLSVSLGYMYLALFRPDKPGQLCADGFCHIHALHVTLCPRVCNRRSRYPVPRFVKAFVQVLPNKNSEVIKLVKSRNPADLEYIFKLF